jgi:SH3-like domain-containing protein
MLRLLVIFFLIFTNLNALANPTFVENSVSHFASIKSAEVNVRRGPNTRYPIEWVFKKKGEPVEVIAQFEHWYRIKDFNGEEGWIKTAMITKKRRAVIAINSQNKKIKDTLYAPIYVEPNNNSPIIAKIEHSKRVDLSKCNKQWCEIKLANLSGWVEKQNLWGVYGNEEFD